MLLDTTIKTSNGSGNTLLITPSAVTGLFTSTKLSSTVTTAKADIGVKVCVQVVGGRVLPNEPPNATDTSCVVFDQRFQQISNTLFSNVALCAAGNAGTVCTSDADCTGGTVCGAARSNRHEDLHLRLRPDVEHVVGAQLQLHCSGAGGQ